MTLRISFETALERFRRQLIERDSAARTIENHLLTVQRLNRMLRLWEPDAEARLKTWHQKLQRQYERDQISGAKVRNDIGVLLAFYDLLVQHHDLDTNPLRAHHWVGRRSPMPKREVWRPRPMPMLDVMKLLAAVGPAHVFDEPDRLRDRAMLELFLNGLRRNEVASLDLDWLTVDTTQETVVVRVRGKGGRVGDVPLHPQSAGLVALHVLLQEAPKDAREWVREALDQLHLTDPQAPWERAALVALARLFEKRGRPKNTSVFRWRGRRIGVRVLNRLFAQYRDQAGLSTSYGPHSLRHTFGSELVEAGEDIRVIQELLRHSDIATTQIYTEVRVGPKARATRRLRPPPIAVHSF
jgi:site-specific recombinase XerC